MLQSLVAVLIVAIGAWLLNVTAKTMCGAEKVIAIASYGLIAAFGARLVWTKGANFIGKFMKTPVSDRQYCTKCGGHLMTNHPPLGLIDVFAATLPELTFRPGVHVNYAETVLPMRDGLPKLKDFPSEFGGSGETILE